MKKQVLIASLMLAAVGGAYAQNLNPKQQYQEDSKKASLRYAEDKKLCAEEQTSRMRMQCLRDAKTEFNNALAAARARQGEAAPVAKNGQGCVDCGRVIAVNISEKEGEGGALGVIAGGVAGALLGNQVGGGTGRDLATLAGAAGGAMAGHKIEQKAKATKVWTVTVQYDNGNKHAFHFDRDPGYNAGDLVRNSGNSIVRR